MRVDVWSDLVCPWCYVGKRRLERALAGFDARGEVEVVHRSFQLNPAAPRDRTTSRVEGLKAKYSLSQLEYQGMEARLLSVAREEGLEFRIAEATGNTFDAHRVAQMGRERGLQDAVVERLFRAYFVEARSIFDAESLISLATEAGLDGASARDMLAGEACADAVAADIQEAASLRVRGVPFFLFDRRYALSGAQPADVFRQALEQAHAEIAGS